MSILFNIITPSNATANPHIGVGFNDFVAIAALTEMRTSTDYVSSTFDVHQHVLVGKSSDSLQFEVDIIDLGYGDEECMYCTYRHNGKNYIGYYNTRYRGLERGEVIAAPIDRINGITARMIAAVEKIHNAYAWAFI